MIWYILFLVLGIACIVGIWHLVCKFYLKDNTLDVILENKKKFCINVLCAVAIVSALCIVPLYKTVKCSTRGTIQKIDTDYSWVLGKCLGETTSGAYIDMDLQRGLPTDSTQDVQ